MPDGQAVTVNMVVKGGGVAMHCPLCSAKVSLSALDIQCKINWGRVTGSTATNIGCYCDTCWRNIALALNNYFAVKKEG